MTNRSLSRYNRGMSDPMDDFFNQSLERFFGVNPFGGMMRSNNQDGNNRGHSLPAVNVSETEDGFRVDVAAPGMSKDSFNIDIENKILTISAESKQESEDKDEESGYHRREFSYSNFQRQFTLPDNIKDEEISANYEDGVLKIQLPKVPQEEAQSKKRSIEIG